MGDFERVRVLGCERAAEGIDQLVLDDAPFVASYTRPGQYVVLRLADGRQSYFARASSPGEPSASYLIGRGPVADELARLREGDAIESSAARGRGFELERARGLDVLLVGTGTGLGPLVVTAAWLLARRADYGRLHVVHGARTPAHVPLRAELEALEREGVQVDLVFSQHGDSPAYVQDFLSARESDLSRTALVAVGQREMVDALRERLPVRGLDPARILLNL